MSHGLTARHNTRLSVVWTLHHLRMVVTQCWKLPLISNTATLHGNGMTWENVECLRSQVFCNVRRVTPTHRFVECSNFRNIYIYFFIWSISSITLGLPIGPFT